MAAKLYGEAVARIVKDPETAASLTPSHPFGCKRPIIDQGYYETFNRDNVTLVDLRKDPIVEITPTGIRTEQRASRTRRDHLRDRLRRDDRCAHPHRYPWPRRDVVGRLLGVGGSVHLPRDRGGGVPQPVHRPGAGKPLGGNEFRRRPRAARGVDRRLHRLPARNGYRTIEALPDAQREWIEHTTALVAPTVLVHPSCNSWYNGGNVPGKKRMYMGYTAGIPEYRQAVRRDRGRGLHRVQARMKASERARLIGRDFAGVLPRAHAAVASSDDWNPLSQRGARQLGEVVLDELALSGMTLTAPPPKLERTVDACAAAADGVVRAQRGRVPMPSRIRCRSGLFDDGGSGG